MNKDRFESFPVPVQNVIKEASGVYWEEELQAYNNQLGESAVDRLAAVRGAAARVDTWLTVVR